MNVSHSYQEKIYVFFKSNANNNKYVFFKSNGNNNNKSKPEAIKKINKKGIKDVHFLKMM